MYGGDLNNPTIPFNGVGRVRDTDPTFAVDNYYMINYQKHTPTVSCVTRNFTANVATRITVSWAAPTCPGPITDADNMFLAALNANGEVLIQSTTVRGLGLRRRQHRRWRCRSTSNSRRTPRIIRTS